MINPEKDEITGVETTGHEWDGLKELNNPAPRWWLWVFYVCVVWSIGYWIVYPAWPTLSGHTKGIWNWTQFGQLHDDTQDIVALRSQKETKIKGLTLEQIKNDADLLNFALIGGKFAYRENCAACHGSGAEGGKGYPNLNDDEWLWGGDLNAIYQTIKFGIRSNHAKTRESLMPAFQEMLKPAEISAIAQYVGSLTSGSPKTEKGAGLFKDNCAACHGVNAEGNKELGAPNLADKISLYGRSLGDISSQIVAPRHGMMPHWEGRLSEETIRYLTLYVHSLGGGEASPVK